MNNLPMTLPTCKDHGEMQLRDPKRMTPEQEWCGIWYDCQACSASVLFTSEELQNFLVQQRAA